MGTQAGSPWLIKHKLYIYTLRFSTSPQHNIFDTDDPIASAAQKKRPLSVGRKRKVHKDAEDR